MSSGSEATWFAILLGAAVKGTVVLAAAGLVAWALGRRSAAARHLVWTGAAAALLALPFLSVTLPALPVPAAAAILPGSIGVWFHAEAAAAGEQPAPPPLPGGSRRVAQPAAWQPDARLWLLLLWAAGAAAAMAQMLLAAVGLWRLRRAARTFPDPDLCRGLARSLGIAHEVKVLETGRGGMPMTCGFARPVILMPADAAEWTADRRAMVLLHELAHVRRGDAATHLLARAALSLYWWNPLAWLAWRQFVKERERAADDVVLNAGARAAEYAGHLLDVARTLQAQPAAGWAVAMARRSQLEGRLLAILDSRANRQSPGRAAALAGVMLAIALVAPFAAIQAQIPSAAPEVDATMRAAASQKNYEMLEQAAAAYENLKNYDAAGQLLEAALAIRGDLSGQNSPDYAAGLLKLGDLARRRNKPAEAANFYAKAVALGDTPEAAGALIFIGTQSLRNTARAQDFFERALAVAPSGPLAGRAKTWQARLAQFEGDASQAELLYLQALAMNPPETPDAALTMELYATLLRQQARPDEAEPYEARAAAVRQAHAAEVSPRRADAEPALKIGRSAEGEIVPPKLLEKVEPVYTQEAKAAKLAGTMRVYVEIATDGRAYNMRIVQGLGLGLEDAAVDAISQWRFQPATRDGIPVPAQATVEINWRLM